jgi:uncharacterized iron-regulated membrane protein
MSKFRNVVFWLHLISGAVAGLIIFVMSVTGAFLAFERQIIEFSEREARYVSVEGRTEKLTPQQVADRFREQMPDAKPTAMAITNEPGAAWSFNLGREGIVYIDPYSGAITGRSNASTRAVMSELRNWHRYIALSGDNRPIGKAITGASNLLFLFLAISGIYIWFPRKISWRSVKPVIWFKRGVSGKARNFNWHNTIGFWTSLLLIIFTLTATVISYQWASDLLYTLTGNAVPERANGGGGGQREEPEYQFPNAIDPAWSAAAGQAPEWRSISLKLPITKDEAVYTIDEGIYWNIFGRSTMTVDAATGASKKWEPYGEQNSARQLRSWFRFTHTGETGGLVGQFLGMIACIGGAFLVWTGFSLALRRLQNWWKRRGSPDERMPAA